MTASDRLPHEYLVTCRGKPCSSIDFGDAFPRMDSLSRISRAALAQGCRAHLLFEDCTLLSLSPELMRSGKWGTSAAEASEMRFADLLHDIYDGRTIDGTIFREGVPSAREIPSARRRCVDEVLVDEHGKSKFSQILELHEDGHPLLLLQCSGISREPAGRTRGVLFVLGGVRDVFSKERDAIREASARLGHPFYATVSVPGGPELTSKIIKFLEVGNDNGLLAAAVHRAREEMEASGRLTVVTASKKACDAACEGDSEALAEAVVRYPENKNPTLHLIIILTGTLHEFVTSAAAATLLVDAFIGSHTTHRGATLSLLDRSGRELTFWNGGKCLVEAEALDILQRRAHRSIRRASLEVLLTELRQKYAGHPGIVERRFVLHADADAPSLRQPTSATVDAHFSSDVVTVIFGNSSNRQAIQAAVVGSNACSGGCYALACVGEILMGPAFVGMLHNEGLLAAAVRASTMGPAIRGPAVSTGPRARRDPDAPRRTWNLAALRDDNTQPSVGSSPPKSEAPVVEVVVSEVPTAEAETIRIHATNGRKVLVGDDSASIWGASTASEDTEGASTVEDEDKDSHSGLLPSGMRGISCNNRAACKTDAISMLPSAGLQADRSNAMQKVLEDAQELDGSSAICENSSPNVDLEPSESRPVFKLVEPVVEAAEKDASPTTAPCSEASPLEAAVSSKARPSWADLVRSPKPKLADLGPKLISDGVAAAPTLRDVSVQEEPGSSLDIVGDACDANASLRVEEAAEIIAATQDAEPGNDADAIIRETAADEHESDGDCASSLREAPLCRCGPEPTHPPPEVPAEAPMCRCGPEPTDPPPAVPAEATPAPKSWASLFRTSTAPVAEPEDRERLGLAMRQAAATPAAEATAAAEPEEARPSSDVDAAVTPQLALVAEPEDHRTALVVEPEDAEPSSNAYIGFADRECLGLAMRQAAATAAATAAAEPEEARPSSDVDAAATPQLAEPMAPPEQSELKDSLPPDNKKPAVMSWADRARLR